MTAFKLAFLLASGATLGFYFARGAWSVLAMLAVATFKKLTP